MNHISAKLSATIDHVNYTFSQNALVTGDRMHRCHVSGYCFALELGTCHRASWAATQRSTRAHIGTRVRRPGWIGTSRELQPTRLLYTRSGRSTAAAPNKGGPTSTAGGRWVLTCVRHWRVILRFFSRAGAQFKQRFARQQRLATPKNGVPSNRTLERGHGGTCCQSRSWHLASVRKIT